MPPYLAPFAPPQSAGIGFSITSFVLAAIAVLVLPIVFGVAAIVFGAVARKRGERRGQLAFKLAVIATIVGTIFGVLVRLL
jgi:hypothetical protein